MDDVGNGDVFVSGLKKEFCSVVNSSAVNYRQYIMQKSPNLVKYTPTELTEMIGIVRSV